MKMKMNGKWCIISAITLECVDFGSIYNVRMFASVALGPTRVLCGEAIVALLCGALAG